MAVTRDEVEKWRWNRIFFALSLVMFVRCITIFKIYVSLALFIQIKMHTIFSIVCMEEPRAAKHGGRGRFQFLHLNCTRASEIRLYEE